MLRRKIIKLWQSLLPSIILIVLLEGGLRVFDIAPTGYFHFLIPAKSGLYSPNTQIDNDWGHISYQVNTNEYGLRITTNKTQKRRRDRKIALIGDSTTEGYFVSDSLSYPYQLQSMLDHAKPQTWEVLNCGKGGASIDSELAILKEIVIPLNPERLVLTFTTNDIANILELDSAQVLSFSLEEHRQHLGTLESIFIWTVTHSALGELAYQWYWESFMKQIGNKQDVEINLHHQENIYLFDSLYGETDGLVLKELWDVRTKKAFETYLIGLRGIQELCLENGIEMVFVYFPAYPQVYHDKSPNRIQQMLEQACIDLGIPFLDLTEKFQNAKEPLYFAPIDFHPTAKGNELMARSVSELILQHVNEGQVPMK